MSIRLIFPFTLFALGAMLTTGCDDGSGDTDPEPRFRIDAAPEEDGGVEPDEGLDFDEGVEADEGIEPDEGVDPDEGIEPDEGVEPDEGMGDGGIDDCTEPEVLDCQGVEFAPCEGRVGLNGATLLKGTVVTDERVYCNGEVLIDRDSKRIVCVGEDCSGERLATEATVVCADIVMPGIIDPHNHMSFNTLPRWESDRLFLNRDQWRSPVSREMYDARPSSNDPVAARYNELRLLLSGTTSVHKAQDLDSSHDHVRNLDRGEDAHHLPYEDFEFTECVFPLGGNCSIAPNYMEQTRIPARAYVAHVAEGIDQTSRSEFTRFDEQGQLGDKTTVVHCVSCQGAEMSRMRAAGARLVWSPQSNLALYGQTTDIPTALNMGVPVSIGPDWTPSGTMNQLAEMKCAQYVGQTYWGGRLDDQTVVRMVTDMAAETMGIDDLVGKLEAGLYADVLALGTGTLDRTRPHAAIIASQATDVRGVFIGGTAYYGDPDALNPANQWNAFCEPLELCGSTKTLCVRTEDGAPDVNNGGDWRRFGLNDMIAYLQRVIDGNRPANLDPRLEYVYQLYPAYECASDFACEMGNDFVSGLVAEGDADGDDVPDDMDNCPDVFNVDQGDLDADGTGDACDDCPWAEAVCPCPAPTAADLDADDVPDGMDNCPAAANPDQTDTDGDGRGDECDFCPESADGGDQGCPASIEAIKRLEFPIGQAVEVTGVVTAVVPAGAPGSQPGSFFMESEALEGDGPDVGYRGLYLYMGDAADGIAPPAVGDFIEVVGVVNVFFGQTQLFRVGRLELLEGEGALPDALTTDVDTIAARGAELESQRVCVNDVQVVQVNVEPGPGDSAPTNEFAITDGGVATLKINDLLHLAEPAPRVGDRFRAVCGVLRFANDAFKIEPRGADDLVPGPPVVDRVEPPLTFIAAGASAVPAGPEGQPLSVVLSRPAPEEGAAIVVAVEPEGALVYDGPLMIEAGVDRIELPFTAGAEADGDVQVSVATAEQVEPLAVTVRVVPPDAEPAVMNFVPEAALVNVGAEVEMALTFDVPVPPDYLIEMSAEPAGLVLAPVELELEGGLVQVRFNVQGLAEGETTLTATAGELQAVATVTVIDVPPVPKLTEVNYDMAGEETLEFVEIHNPGGAPMAVDDMVLELVNGNNNQPYRDIPLNAAGGSIPPGGYLVVGDPAVGDLLPPEALFIGWVSTGNNHDIQNGDPDGVRIMQGDVVLDGVVYGGGSIPSVTDEPSAPDDGNDGAGQSIQRCPLPDGPWDLYPISPGAPTACE